MSITGGVMGDGLYEEISCGSDTCRLFGDIVNWIIVVPSGGTFGTSATITIPNTVFTNAPYADTWSWNMKLVKD